jgi:hypothetical protein
MVQEPSQPRQAPLLIPMLRNQPLVRNLNNNLLRPNSLRQLLVLLLLLSNLSNLRYSSLVALLHLSSLSNLRYNSLWQQPVVLLPLSSLSSLRYNSLRQELEVLLLLSSLSSSSNPKYSSQQLQRHNRRWHNNRRCNNLRRHHCLRQSNLPYNNQLHQWLQHLLNQRLLLKVLQLERLLR